MDRCRSKFRKKGKRKVRTLVLTTRTEAGNAEFHLLPLPLVLTSNKEKYLKYQRDEDLQGSLGRRHTVERTCTPPLGDSIFNSDYGVSSSPTPQPAE